jgi:putative sigma-54 modulation protein
MRIQIHSKNFRLFDRQRERMERSLRFALARFHERILSVTVGFADVNGPRGGADKQCRLVVRMPNCDKITIEETSGNVLAAVASASERAGRAVARELQRRRNPKHVRRSIRAWPEDISETGSFRSGMH